MSVSNKNSLRKKKTYSIFARPGTLHAIDENESFGESPIRDRNESTDWHNGDKDDNGRVQNFPTRMDTAGTPKSKMGVGIG